MFAEKLDLLMHIAEISNIQLASEVHLDPSYISKLRNGKRTLPKQSDFLVNLSAYLSRQIKREHQKKIIEDITQEKWSDDLNKSEKIIFNWLCEDRYSSDMISKFLNQISMPVKMPNLSSKVIKSSEKEIESKFYIGIEGKRKAVLHFFNKILESDNIYNLKLFSEEESSWLLEEPEFLKMWRKVFEDVLKKGNKITIIHNLSRDLDDLMESVVQWIPVYMTGAISPFFCPRKRDGIFQRTIFLAPELVALASNSVSLNSKDMLNTLITEKDALKAVEREYDEYLKICRPLMDIVSTDYINQYKRLFSEIKGFGGTTYYKSKLPSITTMPREFVCELENYYKVDIVEAYNMARKILEKTLEESEVHVILEFPKILKEKVKIEIPQSVFLEKKMYYSSQEELKLHYAEVLKLLKKYKNYYVYFANSVDENLNIFVKSDSGVLVERLNHPSTLFGIKEQNMTSAFSNHMEDFCRFSKTKEKEKTIKYLEKLLN